MLRSDLIRIVHKEYMDRGFEWKYISVHKDDHVDGGQIIYNDIVTNNSFIFDLGNRISYQGTLEVVKELRGNGFGTRLVEAREAICKRIGIETIVLDYVLDPKFWKGRGYKMLGLYRRIKERKRFHRINFKYLPWPKYKDLI